VRTQHLDPAQENTKMNAELEYSVMQHHASELRRAAAEHRRVREAVKGLRGERRHRSFLAKFRAS
jgi:hypothetical protein